MIFKKHVIFGPFSASTASQKEEGGYPAPPFHILKSKIL